MPLAAMPDKGDVAIYIVYTAITVYLLSALFAAFVCRHGDRRRPQSFCLMTGLCWPAVGYLMVLSALSRKSDKDSE